ncbi:MAG: hypothetical protein ACOZQL_15650 [Myxococcota bacterium]
MRERRDWAWPWQRDTVGPLVLSLHFDAPPELPDAWLRRQPELPYREEGPGRWTGPLDVERGELLLTHPQSLEWVRGIRTPPPEVTRFDARTLHQLATGALGPCSWILVDDDSGEPLAGGDDGASLEAHFTAEPALLRPSYARYLEPLQLDLSALATPRAVLEAVAVAMDDWHERHHAPARVLEVKVHPRVGAEWAEALSSPRLRVTVTM